MELLLFGLLVIGALACAMAALRVNRLLAAALWLAVSSALLAALFYMMGAPEIGVIELSVGAGLVTVLFVFAISVAGNEPQDMSQLLPRPLSWVLVLLAVACLAWKGLPSLGAVKGASQTVRFADMLWQQRGLDVLVQIVLIFAGVLGFLGILSPEPKAKLPDKTSAKVEEKHA